MRKRHTPAEGSSDGSTTPFEVEATEEDSGSTSSSSLRIHLVLLIYYTIVNIWSYLALTAASEDESLHYTYRPLRTLCFATMQNLYFQTGYSLLSVLCDVLPASELKRKLRRFLSLIFTTIAFPFAMVVSSYYWTLLAIGTSTLYNEKTLAVLEYIGPLLDHCWHTVVGVAVILELMVVLHRYPSHRIALFISAFITTSYFTQVLVMYHWIDFVPYPFLRSLGIPGMVIFFLCSIPFYLAFYYLGFSLSCLRWRKTELKALTP